MNNILIGLNTIAACLGYNRFDNFLFNQNDMENISDLTGIILNEEGAFDELLYNIDIYSIEGANKFELLQFENEYVIYDKEDDLIVENKTGFSPYNNYLDEFIIYLNTSEEETHYLYANETSIYDLNYSSVLDKNQVETFAQDLSEESGKYYLFDDYGDNAVLIKNSFYFEHLRGLHGNNTDGTCGLVAAQILLSYYDTFQNDNIIAEIYDVTTNFYEAIGRDSVDSPGTDQNFYNYLEDFLVNNDIANSAISMNIYSEKDLIYKYVRSRGIAFAEKWVEGNYGDAMTNAASNSIRDAVNNDRPIFVGAQGHATVAYGYDDNYIYLYDGWGTVRRTPWSTTDTNMFNTNNSPHTVDIINWTGHVHSDNYYYTKWGCAFCPCGYIWPAD